MKTRSKYCISINKTVADTASDFVNKKFYLLMYKDVRLSKIDPEIHYKIYGKSEKRFPNLSNFLGIFDKNQILILTLVKFFLLEFYFTFVFDVKKIKFKDLKIFDKIFVNYLHNPLRTFQQNSLHIILTSWVNGGSQIFVDRYLEHYSKKKVVIFMKGLEHVDNSMLFPLLVKSIKSNQYIISNNLLFINFYVQKLLESGTKISFDFHQVLHLENFTRLIFGFRSITKRLFFHDYYFITNNWSGFNFTRKLLAEEYLKSQSSQTDWRNGILKVSKIIVPSFFVKNVLKFIDPSLDVHFQYHNELSNLERSEVKLVNPFSTDVLIIGDIGEIKGLEVIRRVLLLNETRPIKYNFHHFGKLEIDIKSVNLFKYGSFKRQDLTPLLENFDFRCAFLPFQSPETYSYSLSDVILLGLPLVTSEIGAITERVWDRKRTILLAPDSNSETWLSALDRVLSDEVPSFIPKLTPKELSEIEFKRLRQNLE